jgi:hypothetical protein
MAYKTLTVKTDVVAVDIPNLAAMPLTEYEEYIRNGLLFVDHHDVLRSEPAGYPLAVTQAQVKALIIYLEEIAPKVGSDS